MRNFGNFLLGILGVCLFQRCLKVSLRKGTYINDQWSIFMVKSYRKYNPMDGVYIYTYMVFFIFNLDLLVLIQFPTNLCYLDVPLEVGYFTYKWCILGL